MKTIEEFCSRHGACDEGREWAVVNCRTMAEVWEKAQPSWVVWVSTRPGVLTVEELRLFAVSCARQVEHLLTDSRDRESVKVAYAQAAVRVAARTAYSVQFSPSLAYAAAVYAAMATSDLSTTSNGGISAAYASIREDQAAWLHKHTSPNFGE
jgi:hypothetical protein